MSAAAAKIEVRDPQRVRAVYARVQRDVRRRQTGQCTYDKHPSEGDALLTAYRQALDACVAIREALQLRDGSLW